MEEQIFEILFKEDDLSWQTILYDLVRIEAMDPWDIDVSILATKYIGMIKKMQGTDIKVSGKVLLASAILLKLKAEILGENMDDLDRMMNSTEEDLLAENFMDEAIGRPAYDSKPLIPRTPQLRKRKVSIFDLVGALEGALKVTQRRIARNANTAPAIRVPDKKIDITTLIDQLYRQIGKFFKSNPSQKLFFHNLLPSREREAIIYTFMPLLHLTCQRKVDLCQHSHFGDIEIVKAGALALPAEIKAA